MSHPVPTWPLVEHGRLYCPVCRQETLASLALIDYRGRALAPDFAQTLLGPLKCEGCGWKKGETRT